MKEEHNDVQEGMERSNRSIFTFNNDNDYNTHAVTGAGNGKNKGESRMEHKVKPSRGNVKICSIMAQL